MPATPRRPITRLAIAVLTAAVFVAGCSSGGSDGASSSSRRTSTTDDSSSTATTDRRSLRDQVGDLDGLVDGVAGEEGSGSTTTTSRRTKPGDQPKTSPPLPRRTTPTPTDVPATDPPATIAPTTTPRSRPCNQWRQTKYIPANSSLEFERNGVTVSVRRVYYKALTLQVSSSDGTYRETAIDPDATLFEGLVVTTSSLGMGFEWNYLTEQFEMKPGQVSTIVRVQDCWTYTWGPADVF